MTPVSAPLTIPLDSRVLGRRELEEAIQEQALRLAGPGAEVALTEKELRVVPGPSPVNDIKLAAAIHEIVDRLQRSHVIAQRPPIFENNCEPSCSSDPFPELRSSGQVAPLCEGVFSYTGRFRDSLESVDRFFRRAARRLGAQDFDLPSTVALDRMIGCGYLNSFPHHALFATSAKSDPGSLSSVARMQTSSAQALPTTDIFANPGQVLLPALCYGCFDHLSRTNLNVDRAVFTVSGPCHRIETVYDRLLRLQTFRMREIVFLGSPDFIQSTRDLLLRFCRELMCALGMKFRIAPATDPFFAVGSEGKRVYQILHGTKYELQVYVPFNNSWCAVMSFNDHKTALTKAFGIGERSIHSGCFGVGLERFVYSIACQLGPAPLRLSRLWKTHAELLPELV